MTREQKLHILPDTVTAVGDLPPLAMKQLSKQEFARRLFARMSSKKMRQADLSRATGLTRNNISTYIRGICFPNNDSLEKLAKALSCKPEDLLPNARGSAIQNELAPDMSLAASQADPGFSWLTVNRLVSTEVAVEILGLLTKDRAKNARVADR